MSYEEALAWIHSLARFGSRLGLERITRLLELLDNPHHGLRVVHVGGTNGKGSVTAVTASILREAGYRVGRYISPYLEDFRERITLDDRPIPPDRLASLVARVRPAADQMIRAGQDSPTEFEVVTALGFLYFAEEAADFVCLEVGLGGRYDATNVVRTPEVAAITTIALDHTEQLGRTPERIAWEKGGIIKAGRPVVTGVTSPGPLAVLEDIARRQGSRMLCAGRDFRWEPRQVGPDGQTFDLDSARHYRGLALALRGRHQLHNAAIAVVCAEVMEDDGVRIGEAAIRRGLALTHWPGRLELLQGDPEVLLDAAHNPEGARALAQALAELWPDRRKVLVMGVLADKDAEAMLGELVGATDAMVCARPLSPRALPPERLAALAGRLAGSPGRALPLVVAEDLDGALERGRELARPDGLVVVAGSIYLVGAARSTLRRKGYAVEG